jgi:glycosyltransferase involved in cell wall biosynthesis
MTKKILFISDFKLEHSLGGAQRSNSIIINKGIELGHHIIEATYDSNFEIIDFDYFDIIISSNLEYIYRSYPNIISKISNHKYHVRLEHDLNRYMSQEDRKKLFESCQKTIFLTNFHHQLFINNYGDIFKNVEIVADPIDTSLFYNKQLQRENKILYVGFLHELKGTLIFFDFVMANPMQKFVVAGWGSPVFEFLSKNLPNVEYLGRIEYDQMPNLYNKYESIFYNPVLPEPFCRSICEALFCGMKIIYSSSKMIGCLNELESVGEEKLKFNCENAANIFWNKIS